MGEEWRYNNVFQVSDRLRCVVKCVVTGNGVLFFYREQQPVLPDKVAGALSSAVLRILFAYSMAASLIYLILDTVMLLTPKASRFLKVALYPSGPFPRTMLISSITTGSTWMGKGKVITFKL